MCLGLVHCSVVVLGSWWGLSMNLCHPSDHENYPVFFYIYLCSCFYHPHEYFLDKYCYVSLASRSPVSHISIFVVLVHLLKSSLCLVFSAYVSVLSILWFIMHNDFIIYSLIHLRERERCGGTGRESESMCSHVLIPKCLLELGWIRNLIQVSHLGGRNLFTPIVCFSKKLESETKAGS